MPQIRIELFAAIYFFAIGFSHVVQPHAWVEFFVSLRGKGRSGAFTEGFLALSLGALIVSFHNVWSGPHIVLTLVGWAQVAKGIGRFAAPQLALRVYQTVSHERAWRFRVGGAFSVALAAYLAWLLTI